MCISILSCEEATVGLDYATTQGYLLSTAQGQTKGFVISIYRTNGCDLSGHTPNDATSVSVHSQYMYYCIY